MVQTHVQVGHAGEEKGRSTASGTLGRAPRASEARRSRDGYGQLDPPSTPEAARLFPRHPDISDVSTANLTHRTAIGSSGIPLPADVRETMEQRFGHDFGNVRIHSDASAARAAHALHARAFASGRDIVFGAARYAPNTSEGRQLLAHELAHVVQQSRGGIAPRADIADARLEADAEKAATAVVDGFTSRIVVTASSGVGIACAPLSREEIARLDREQLAARLLANEREHSQKVWGPEYYRQLEAENIALKEALSARVTATRAPVPGPPPDARRTSAEEEAVEAPNPLLPANSADARSMEFKGIAPFGLPEVPVTQGSGPSRPLKAGPYILGPNAIQCQNGEWAVLYYVAHHLEKKENHWVVGPGSAAKFTTEAEERARQGKRGDKDARGLRMPGANIPLSREHASEQRQTGIKPAYMVRALPYTSGESSHAPVDAGPYRLVPKSVRTARGGEELLYYAAWDKTSNVVHYIVGPDSVDAFKASADAQHTAGAVARMGGEPHEYEAESVRFVDSAMSGNFGAAWKHWKGSWSLASKDPKWQLQALGAHVPVNRVIAPIIRPLARTAREGTVAIMLGTRRAAPALTMDVAPKAVIQTVERAATTEVRQATASRAAQSLAPETAQVAAREAAPVAAGGAARAQAATGVTAPAAEAVARAGISQGMSAVLPETDRDVEQAFTEWQGPVLGPVQQPPLRRPTRTQDAQRTRDDFGQVRNAYAQALQVAAYGQVHHAIEVQVLSRYPGVYAPGDINRFTNMRGIPPELNRRTQLHNSKIREIIDRHYRALDDEIARRNLRPGTREYNDLVRSYMDSAVAQVDWSLGIFFSEQRAGLPLMYTPP